MRASLVEAANNIGVTECLFIEDPSHSVFSGRKQAKPKAKR